MRIIRKELSPLVAFAFPTRYNEATDTVEASFDGGTTWESFPEGDPRKNNHTPPPDTADPRCDAAARISAATQEVVTYVIDELDATAAVITIVQGFLRLFTPLFTLVPYLSLVYSAVTTIATIGAVAMHSAFDAFDWGAFKCLIFKHMSATGELSDAGFAELLADIAATYSDATETVLYNFYLLTGRAGLNDQAGIRTETGDCTACPTTWTHSVTPISGDAWYWIDEEFRNCAGTNLGTAPHGQITNDMWYTQPRGANNLPSFSFGGGVTIPAGSTLTHVTFTLTIVAGSNLDGSYKQFYVQSTRKCHDGAFYSGWNDITGSWTAQHVLWKIRLIAGNGTNFVFRIPSVTFSGTGVNPFL